MTPGECLSRAELAELVNAYVFDHHKRTIELDANYIGKLERGQIRWPQADYRAGFRKVLNVRTDGELGFRRSRRSKTSLEAVNRSEFLRAALGVTAAATPLAQTLLTQQPTPVPSVVGSTEINEVRTAAKVFSTWDHTYGGSLVREAVTAQLRYSASLLEAQTTERWRSDLFAAVADLGDVAGFMAFDACAFDDATRIFKFALACADESGDWHIRAKVLSSMARQAIHCGDPDTGLTLVELAMVRSDRLTATERAGLLVGRARALAKLNCVQDALRTIGMADDEFANAEPANDPPWMVYMDPAQHVGDTGHALHDIALNGKFINETRQRLASAVAGHDPGYVRPRVFSELKLATLALATGDPVEGATMGLRTINEAAGLRSGRVKDYVLELRSHAQQHHGLSETGYLVQQIDQTLTAL